MKKRNIKIIIWAALVSLSWSWGSGQETAASRLGTVSGLVADARSGEAVSGATVALLEAPSFSGRTDLRGRFRFTEVEPGSYTVRVFKSGYEPFDVTDVEVEAGDATEVEIPLPRRGEEPAELDLEEEEESGQDIFELEAFEVTAEAVESTQVSLLRERQRSDTIGDAIGSDSFSRLGLGDAAEAMTKVTGASVVDGKYVFIRGLGDRYSNTLLNGATVPSADPDRRAVQMDQFPSDLLESIVTSKSFTPDQPGSFSGGSVNVQTKSFPEQFFVRAGASASYNTQTTGEDLFVSRQGVDWTARGVDDRPRTQAAPDEIPRLSGRSVETATGAALQGDLSVAERLDAITREFPRQFYPGRESALPSHGINLSLGDTLEFGNDRRFGYTVSLTWDRDYSYYDEGIEARWASPNDFKIRGQVYTTEPAVLDKLTWYRQFLGVLDDPYDGDIPFGVRESVESVNWGAFSKFALLPSENHELSLTFFHNQSAEDEIKLGVGDGFNSALSGDTLFEATSVKYTERGITSTQFHGEHKFPETGDLGVEWQASLSSSTQDQPDFRTVFTAWDYEEQQYRNVNPTDLDPPVRRYREMTEDNEEYSLDFTLPMGGDLKLKWGGVLGEAERDYSELNYFVQPSTWQGQPDTALVRGIYTEPFIGFDFDQVEGTDLDGDGEIDRYNINPALSGRHVIERGSEGNKYTGDSSVEAVYLMADFGWGEDWRVITGARWESNRMDVLQLLESRGVENRPGGFTEDDILPAFSLVYALSEAQNIRLAYGRTLALPTFKELAPVVIEDSFTGDKFQGNPELGRTLIDNLDLRWEWFREGAEMVAVSLFWKEMDQPIEKLFFGGEDVNGDGRIDNLDLQPFQRGNIVPQNVESATVYGIELEARYALGRLSPALEAFTIGGNLSLIESEVDVPPDEQLLFGSPESRQLVGQSPFLLNLDLSYDNDEWGTYLNLSYNYTGERLAVVNPNTSALGDVFEQPVGRLNLTYTQRLNGYWKMKLSAENLLDPEFEQTYEVAGGRDLVYQRYQRGITFGISFTYTFE